MKHKPKLKSTLATAAFAGVGLMFLASEAMAAQGPQPSICNRSCWTARAPKSTATQMSSLTRAIIHHTANSSDYTTDYETAKARVRNVQNIHMDSNGWSDIGYHFLVSAGGHIFEGRSGSMSSLPQGAHDGYNVNSFGFTLLGYFHSPYNQDPNATMRGKLYDTIAWRMPSAWSPYGSGSYNSKTVGYLDGHRKVKATACPGDKMHVTYITEDYNGGDARNGVNARKNRKKTDFNGDGKSDIATFTRGSAGDVYVSISGGSGFGAGSLWHGTFAFGTEIPLSGDFNGDGKTDIVTFVRGGYNGAAGVSDGNVYVALSGGSGFGASVLWHEFFCAGTEIPMVGDVNGDGKDDIISFVRGTGSVTSAAGDVYVALSTGSSFGAAQKWSDWFCVGDEIPAVGDFNGDGKADIASFYRGGYNGAGGVIDGNVWVALSSGSGFGSGVLWHEFFCAGTEIPMVGDVNGDGKADIISFVRGTGSVTSVAGDVYVALSTGSSFGAAQKWSDWFCVGDELPGVGDFNGDGKDDIISFVRGTGEVTSAAGDVFVGLSNGAGFGSAKWSDWFCVGTEVPQPGPNAVLWP